MMRRGVEADAASSERVNVTERTARRLHELLASSGLKPGSPFATEIKLEKRLKVSRPILREAVNRLRALGFLESRQRVGLIIGKPDPVALFARALETFVLDEIDLAQLAELRFTLELGVVGFAVQRATPRQVKRLRELAEEYALSQSRPGLGRPQDDIECDFHRTILEATHNSLLIRMNQVLAAFFARMSREQPRRHGFSRNPRSARQHRAIAQAFADRNADTARTLLAAHLRGLIRARPYLRAKE